MKNTKKKMPIIFLCLTAVFLWLYWGNRSIEVSLINVEDALIPESFHDFTIVQISDLHNSEFGKNQRRLLQKIRAANPDIIVITGDLIDSDHTDIKTAMTLVKNAVSIAPVYFITGNHEAWTPAYADLKKQLQQAGISILDDDMVSLRRNHAVIQLVGLADPDFTLRHDYFDETSAMIDQKLQGIIGQNSDYKILLSHRPELIDIYAKNAINLVLSGHAHGGQFRIPFIGGIIAPDQGLFPKYTEGRYLIGQTQMVVSRGLGNSIIPLRINNRPELVIVRLKHSEQ